MIVQYNLDQTMFFLEGTGVRKDEATEQCENCGTTVTQKMNVCPGCDADIVWFNSTVWKKEYGKPDEYIRLVEQKDLSPRTPFEVALVRVYGRRGNFQNTTQQKLAYSLRDYPHGYLMSLLAWASKNVIPFVSYVNACKNTANLEQWRKDERGGEEWWQKVQREREAYYEKEGRDRRK